MATQDDYIKTALRLPRDLHARIQASAESTGKSMNAELIERLEHSFSGGDSPALLRLLARLEMQLAEAEMLAAMSDINITYVLSLFGDAISHISKGTKPTKQELEEWRSELKNYEGMPLDFLEEKMKTSGERLEEARAKMKLSPKDHTFGVYDK